jgi:hypothetical protein
MVPPLGLIHFLGGQDKLQVVFFEITKNHYPKNFVVLDLLRKREAGTVGVQTVHEGFDTLADDEVVDVIFEEVLVSIEFFYSIL